MAAGSSSGFTAPGSRCMVTEISLGVACLPFFSPKSSFSSFLTSAFCHQLVSRKRHPASAWCTSLKAACMVRDVAAVAVQEVEAAEAVPVEAPDDVVDHRHERARTEGDGAGEAHVVGGHPVGERRRDEDAGRLACGAGDAVGGEEIGAAEPVWPVLLGTADGNDDGVGRRQVALDLRPGEMGELHSKPPWPR